MCLRKSVDALFLGEVGKFEDMYRDIRSLWKCLQHATLSARIVE